MNALPSPKMVEIWVGGCEAGLQPVQEPHVIAEPSVTGSNIHAAYITECINTESKHKWRK